MHLDRRLLGWGVFFILLGAVPLAVRSGAADPELVGRWPTIWPLLLIGWGVGLVLRATPVEWVGGAIVAVTFGLMGGGAIATGFAGAPVIGGACSSGPGQPFQTAQGTLGSAGHMTVEFSCGNLTVSTADGSGWQVSGVDRDGRAPTIDTNGTGVTIRSPQRGFDLGGGRTEWTVAVPRAPHLTFGLTMNAGDASVDLAGATLDGFNLTVNAGSLNADLSRVAAMPSSDINGTVNAGSATVALPQLDGAVDLSLNAGSLTVCVPQGTAIEVHWSGTIASNDLDQAGLSKTGDNTWTTPGFVPTAGHLTLDVSANAGSFSLQRGGSCGA